jgi:hypothetical protein
MTTSSDFRSALDQRKRVMATLRQRKHRERKRAAAPQEKSKRAPLEIDISNDRLKTDALLLLKWVEHGGVQQRSIKNRVKEIIVSRWVLLKQRHARHGDDPSLATFAQSLKLKTPGKTWTRMQARKRLELIQRLEQPGGPWHVEQVTIPDELTPEQMDQLEFDLALDDFKLTPEQLEEVRAEDISKH